MKDYFISVIIPTTCKAERKHSLLKAIESINQQEGIDVKIIVVVNGSFYDAPLTELIQNFPDTELVFIETADLALAIEHGRTLVKTKYFSFLDDDDEYLENTLKSRVDELESDSSLDVLVTNGFDISKGLQQVRVKNPDAVNQDPLKALMHYNWLASCGGTFRATTATNEYFEKPIKYYEWTTIAFRVSGSLKVKFVDIPTYLVNESLVSLSKSSGYIVASENIIRMMLSNDKSQNIRKMLNRKLSAVLHTISDFHRHNENLSSAWSYHLKSLFRVGGYRYFGYTRRLFYAFFKSTSPR